MVRRFNCLWTTSSKHGLVSIISWERERIYLVPCWKVKRPDKDVCVRTKGAFFFFFSWVRIRQLGWPLTSYFKICYHDITFFRYVNFVEFVVWRKKKTTVALFVGGISYFHTNLDGTHQFFSIFFKTLNEWHCGSGPHCWSLKCRPYSSFQHSHGLYSFYAVLSASCVIKLIIDSFSFPESLRDLYCFSSETSSYLVKKKKKVYLYIKINK